MIDQGLALDMDNAIDKKDEEFLKSVLPYLDISNTAFLHKAVRSGHAAIVKLLLESGASVDLRDAEENTPLSDAVRSGHAAIAELLLAKGASVHVINKTGNTPLHSAVIRADEAIVKLLLAKGANINMQGFRGKTPLDYAAGAGHTSVVDLLLESGASVHVIDLFKNTPLHAAAKKGYEAIVKLLLAKGANINMQGFRGKTPLSYAAGAGHTSVVDLLLGADADPSIFATGDREGQTPLHVGASRNWVEVAEVFVERDVDINALDKKQSLLCCAAREGATEMVRWLLNKGMDINAEDSEDETALDLAAQEGHIETMKVLLAHRAKIGTASEERLLDLFVETDDVEFRAYLILAGLDIEEDIEDIEDEVEYAKIKSCLQNITGEFESLLERAVTPLEVSAILREFSSIVKLSHVTQEYEQKEIGKNIGWEDPRWRVMYGELIVHLPKEIISTILKYDVNRNSVERLLSRYLERIQSEPSDYLAIVESVPSQDPKEECNDQEAQYLKIVRKDLYGLYFGVRDKQSPVSKLWEQLFTKEFLEKLLPALEVVEAPQHSGP